MRYVNFYLSVLFTCLFSMTAFAGDLDSPGAPADGSGMYSLEDIYNRLNTGASGTQGGPFKEPSAGPTAGTGHNLNEVMGKAPAEDDTNGAAPANVGLGKTFWGLGSGNWGPQTGTMETKTLSPNSTAVAAGYYNDTTLDTVDTDLTSGNIKSSVSIFGVNGSVIESTGDAAAGNVLTGKTFSNADGAGLTGTMTNNFAGGTIMPGTTDQTVAAGYWSSANTVSGDDDLVGSKIKSGVDIFSVPGSVIESTGDAAVGDVLTGKTFSRSGAAGLAGTMANVGQQNVTPGTAAVTITQGYHNGTGQVEGDSGLVSGNIRSGVNIFGVAGNSDVVNTSTGDAVEGEILSGKKAWVDGSEITGTAYPSPVPKTGQTTPYRLEDDGDLETGVTWPNPRFTVTTNGADEVVTDNLTGLMWVREPHAIAGNASVVEWEDAIDSCTTLTFAAHSDWRLPNVRELQTLLDYGEDDLALPSGHPFLGIKNDEPYWTSTTVKRTIGAWVVRIDFGWVSPRNKDVNNQMYVWPVRSGN